MTLKQHIKNASYQTSEKVRLEQGWRGYLLPELDGEAALGWLLAQKCTLT